MVEMELWEIRKLFDKHNFKISRIVGSAATCEIHFVKEIRAIPGAMVRIRRLQNSKLDEIIAGAKLQNAVKELAYEPLGRIPNSKKLIEVRFKGSILFDK